MRTDKPFKPGIYFAGNIYTYVDVVNFEELAANKVKLTFDDGKTMVVVGSIEKDIKPTLGYPEYIRNAEEEEEEEEEEDPKTQHFELDEEEVSKMEEDFQVDAPVVVNKVDASVLDSELEEL